MDDATGSGRTFGPYDEQAGRANQPSSNQSGLGGRSGNARNTSCEPLTSTAHPVIATILASVHSDRLPRYQASSAPLYGAICCE